MGSDTLVDLVNQIWNVASTAVSTIKDAASTALNAVKAGMSFIQDQIMSKIVEMLSFAVEMVFKSFSEIFSSRIDGVSTSHSDGTILMNIEGNSFPIYISESNNRIIIDLAGQKIENGIFDGHYKFETLSSGLDYAKADLDTQEFSLFVNILTIGITLLAVKAPHPFTVVPAVIGLFSSIIMNVIYFKTMIESYNRLDTMGQSNKDEYGDAMIPANLVLFRMLAIVPLAVKLSGLASMGINEILNLFRSANNAGKAVLGYKTFSPLFSIIGGLLLAWNLASDTLSKVGLEGYLKRFMLKILLSSILDGILALFIHEIALKLVSIIFSIFSGIHLIFANIISIKLGRGFAAWN